MAQDRGFLNPVVALDPDFRVGAVLRRRRRSQAGGRNGENESCGDPRRITRQMPVGRAGPLP